MTKQKILFVAFAHTLTEEQIASAKMSLGVDIIKTLQQEAPMLHKEIVQIPATATSMQIEELAQRVIYVAEACEATYLYVAGEPSFFLHTCIKAQFKFIVVQSTTERVSVEKEIDGKIEKFSLFRHVMWREVFPPASTRMKLAIQEILAKPIRPII